MRLVRQTTVGACQALLGIEPLLVGRDTDVLDVVERAAAQPATRLIGVVGEDGRLVGVIPVRKAAESIVARAVPESLLVDIADAESAARFSHSFEDRTAGDIMVEAAKTDPDATIDAAFRLMHQRGLGGLYVVDQADRPTGYLDLLELVIVYVRALEAEAAAQPPTPGDRSPGTRD